MFGVIADYPEYIGVRLDAGPAVFVRWAWRLVRRERAAGQLAPRGRMAIGRHG